MEIRRWIERVMCIPKKKAVENFVGGKE